MDFMSIIGFIAGAVLIVLGILTNTNPSTHMITWLSPSVLLNFWDVPSVLIVMGGTMASLMIAFPASQFAKIPKHLHIIFAPQKYDPNEYIAKIVEFAKKARVSGLLALEDEVEDIEDPFLKNSLRMVVDSVDPEKVKMQMEAQLDYLDDRHTRDRAMYDRGATFAPAFGMIGTLIGLINLMHDLNSSSNSIGANMAVALVTTFYGTILSNLLFTPISNKLRVRHEEEMLCKTIICEGVKGIQSGENPNFIETRLAQLLPDGKYVPSQR